MVHLQQYDLGKYTQTIVVAVNIERVTAVQHLISSPSDVSSYRRVASPRT